MTTESPAWTPDDSAALYGVRRWGGGYFGVNAAGHATVSPDRDPTAALDLPALVDQLRTRGVRTPMLLRFPGILDDRLATIAGAFDAAIAAYGYAGAYRGVYPIKVNQQRHVVEELLAAGRPRGFGLEAGSKPELLAVLALLDGLGDDGGAEPLIVCNGFKDARYIEGVVLANKLGRAVIPVVEKADELPLVLKTARAHGVRPPIGVRVKLASAGAGRWAGSGGERAKFGLFVSEVVEAVALLREHGMLDCLQLVHFHLGSQLTDMRAFKAAVVEAARVYTELAGMGAGLRFLDVGGGMGVDYDGTGDEGRGDGGAPGQEPPGRGAPHRAGGVNYTLREYANNVVWHVGEVCREAGVAAPTLITEAGRAMVAHSTVLVMDVTGVSGVERFEVPERPADLQAIPAPVRALWDALEELDAGAHPRECLHDAEVAREQVLSLFALGHCSLGDRADAERLFYALLARLRDRAPEALEEEGVPGAGSDRRGGGDAGRLREQLRATYFCNGSVFQSLPDAWAIGQRFPVMPLRRLGERPTRLGALADITCDSDGKLDRFIPSADEPGAARPALELHELSPGEDYLLGVFLVGAYQETLGDLHNLFGDVNAVHVGVEVSPGGEVRPRIEEIVLGDTVAEVLGYVQYRPEELLRRFGKGVEAAAADGRLSAEEAATLRRFYEDGLAGYTYLT